MSTIPQPMTASDLAPLAVNAAAALLKISVKNPKYSDILLRTLPAVQELDRARTPRIKSTRMVTEL